MWKALVSVLLLLAAGPTFAQNTCVIRRSLNDFPGSESLSTDGPFAANVVLFKNKEARGDGKIGMMLSKEVGQIQLGFVYFADKWALFSDEDDMLTLIDGERGPQIPVIAVEREALGSGSVREVAVVNLTEEELRELASGTAVRIRLPAQHPVERQFLPLHLECMRRFLAKLEK